MQPDGDTWGARLGPFRAAGPLTWTITAVDTLGNASSAGGKTTVIDCPVG
jgi:hypothetical protein